MELTFNNRVKKLLEHPPEGSGVAAAYAYGADLSMTVRNMFALTPAQRLESLERGAANLAFLRSFRRRA
jgi:hypothetical protein